METCIDPLNSDNPERTVNIVSGRMAPDRVNVDHSVTIGTEQMNIFESSWPENFNYSLPKKVITMSVTKKQVKLGSSDTFDTELIYAQIMGFFIPGK